jgi:threonine synthase
LLRCTECGAEAADISFGPCSVCRSGALEVVTPLGAMPALHARPPSIWHYASLMPTVPADLRLTLGEGGTPLVDAEIAGRAVLIKHEGVNPTLSFKDRYSAVNVSVARSLAYQGVVLSSTGNAGLAAATYARIAGMRARVICPPTTPADIQRAIIAVGGELLLRPRRLHTQLVADGIRDGYFPASRGYPYEGTSPFGVEGYKTIAYEIVAALGDAPAAVFMPLGGGDGVFGVHKGFRELSDLGVARRVPRMIGVRTPWRWATSISGDAPGRHALRAIEVSGGHVATVARGALVGAMRALADVGVLAEPASATSVAAFIHEQSSTRTQGDPTVCVVTSHLAKWWEHAERGAPWPPRSS